MTITPYGSEINTELNRKNLGDVTVIDDSNYNNYASFIKDCTENYYNHTYKYSEPPVSYEVNNFFNWLQSNSLYIINKDNRNLGFIVLHHNDTADNSVISYSFFVHPSVCKLNSLQLILSGMILSVYKANMYGSKLITTYANHTLLTNTVNGYFPDTKQYLLQTNLFFFTINLSGMSAVSIENILNNSFKKDDLTSYKKCVS